MNKSFVFFVDWIPVLELLDTKEEYDEVLEAIRSMIVEEEPKSITRPKAKKVWRFIEPKLRNNMVKYEETKAKRIEALKKYNEKRRVERNDNDTLTQRQRDVNDTTTNDVTVTVTDTVTDTVTVTGSTNVDVGGCKGDLRSRFTPPTLADVEMFIIDNSYESLVDPETFFNYYQARGWTVGKGETKMKDWRAALRNWAARERKSLVMDTAEGNPFTNIDWGDDE